MIFYMIFFFNIWIIIVEIILGVLQNNIQTYLGDYFNCFQEMHPNKFGKWYGNLEVEGGLSGEQMLKALVRWTLGW